MKVYRFEIDAYNGTAKAVGKETRNLLYTDDHKILRFVELSGLEKMLEVLLGCNYSADKFMELFRQKAYGGSKWD